ncbi:Conserved hypothetical protein [Shewanella piezotolerans WP3]|uniref:Uncharacterized protein n=1 Tax=Shewanella piezotolerans (strain WP3 / JCM 13877) TaxID=225849 RepID=B8CSQ9_SHEPW|nr:hypothetical protein [Shewanella piezotolerans]ACJ30685.1 Conserved hypothetical protein [Shewanella piezotolerans WP3]
MKNFGKTGTLQQATFAQTNRLKIIGIAESIHYLVGAVDSNKNFIELTEKEESLVVQAKQLLRNHRYQLTQLKYQTAYNEICGLKSSSHYHQMLKL